MKCPACGFETPEDQGWCDFCKEPFRKKSAEPAPPPPPPSKTVQITPELLERLQEAKHAVSAREPTSIPPEFAQLDSGERIGGASEMTRTAAWLFLAMILVWAVILGVVAVRRMHANEPLPAAPDAAATSR
ncbi:MAG TPA: hypothetical protein VNI01_05335 [Elusimicrobiota bacterium]|nr:hypothetical protein [Elusimicrobiota bacterium]